ncbi:alginate export family protein [Asaia prunellae]|uniref:alginate export family protein n=1 Tax=Asaia prunellae TaxID=610245 RepID=UPI0024347CE4|nr:alginate export family protein [Asaia prunellae]
MGTYIAPFNPQTNYLDTTTYIAPSNLVSFSPVIRLTPRNWLSFQFKSPLFWRASTSDSVYGPSGAYAFSNLHGGFVGIVPQASLTLQLNRHLTWTQYGARFIGSDGLRAAGGKNGSYYQSNFVFRF